MHYPDLPAGSMDNGHHPICLVVTMSMEIPAHGEMCVGNQSLYFLNPKRNLSRQDCNENLTKSLCQSIICRQGAEWPTERQEKMSGVTCRERERNAGKESG